MAVPPGRAAVDHLSAEIVERMRALLPSQSKEAVAEALGISANTWLKLKRGEPIRSSVAERLKRSFGEDKSL